MRVVFNRAENNFIFGRAHQVTRLLDAVRNDEPTARERLLDAVYHELRAMAAAHMAREAPGRTLQPTALVHEAWLRLFGRPATRGGSSNPTVGQPETLGDCAIDAKRTSAPDSAPDPSPLSSPAPVAAEQGAGPHFENRRQFFKAAAIAMRRILVEGARKRGRKKRGHGRPPQSLINDPPDSRGEADFDADELLAVDEAMAALERADPELAEVVHQRYFVGLSVDQTAAVLGIAPRTVDKRWRMARAWLHRALDGEKSKDESRKSK